MAGKVRIHGAQMILVNVYAPRCGEERVALFAAAPHDAPAFGGPVFVGADFNCTLYPLFDRSRESGQDAGTRRIPNDFYRDFADGFLPVLEVVFNVWLDAGVTPASFASIHATIDTYLAAQDTAAAGQGHADALCLQLDFQKAYDSLNRGFFEAVLTARGFPRSFVRTVIRDFGDVSGLRIKVSKSIAIRLAPPATDSAVTAIRPAELALRAGGIGLSNVKAELLALAASVVGTWASAASPFGSRVGEVRMGLAGPVYLGPSPHAGPSDGTKSMSTAGCAAARAVFWSATTPDEVASVTQCADAVRQHAGLEANAQWRDDIVSIGVRERLADPLQTRATECKGKGRFRGMRVIRFSHLDQRMPLSAASRRILLRHCIAATMTDSTSISRGTEIPAIVAREAEKRSKIAMHAHPRKAQQDAAAATPTVPRQQRRPVEVSMAVCPWSELLRIRGLNTYAK
ncbi:hypothetical protein PybrP1_002221 [[Pythium] brassicae (nom. inval.)]|nr:hypothetical protein PybrP1_002221 [[Pythium] brassicae (nom. inval.)]